MTDRTLTVRVDSRPPELWEAIGFTVLRDADGHPQWLVQEATSGTVTRRTQVRWGAAEVVLTITGDPSPGRHYEHVHRDPSGDLTATLHPPRTGDSALPESLGRQFRALVEGLTEEAPGDR